jgi:NAD(P)-dependent dehydrogenase (short-subunit alcohol dehydrogenase family)
MSTSWQAWKDRDMGRLGTLAKIGIGTGAVLGVRELVTQANEIDLRGKVVLITGASSGLGLEMARDMASQGARLAICARTEEELQRAQQDLEERGATVLAIACDVGVEAEATRLVAETIDHFGHLDILVCNAGVIQVGHIHSLSSDEFRSAMDIMYFGTLYPILAAIPHMRERQRGHIALVTSIGGKIAVPYLMPYDAAKFAAVGLGEGLRAELAPDGIKVTTIIPGLMRTGSYLNAEFAGEEDGREAMYRLFSTMSSLPGLTADGQDAARHFVKAIRRGDTYTIYPPQYVLVSKIHDIAPALTASAMSLVSRAFPATGDQNTVVEGESIDDRLPAYGPWRFLTSLGRQAADRMQLRPGAGDP